jgi:hypothetical protein
MLPTIIDKYATRKTNKQGKKNKNSPILTNLQVKR